MLEMFGEFWRSEVFWGIVFGALISSFTGVVSAYFVGRKRDHDYKREYIYRTLCNKISNLLTRDWTFFSGKLETYWNDIESYLRTMIDTQLKDTICLLDNEIEAYNKLREKYEETLEKFLPGLEDAVREAFPPHLVENEYIRKGRGSFIEIEKFVNLFKEPLLVWNGGKGFYERLVDYKPAGHKQTLRKWHSEIPELFDRLEQEISSLKKSLEDEFLTLEKTYKELKGKIDTIIGYAKKLKEELRERINKLW